MNQILVKKVAGKEEFYSREKLIASLERAGTSLVAAYDIVDEIEKHLSEFVTTDEIFKTAFKILRKKEKKPAIKYSIKRSMLSLGPTGFPFEKFIARLFAEKGYQTETGLILRGNCVDHEIDVVAIEDDKLILIEAKFHNDLSMKSDTKVALYVKARFDDLRKQSWNIDGKVRKMSDGLLVTNTKFTDNAIAYGECAGLNMLSWLYPRKGNLLDIIDETKIYPITCLFALSQVEKKELLAMNILDIKHLDQEIKKGSDLPKFHNPKTLEREIKSILESA
jgi:hypothetical protein